MKCQLSRVFLLVSFIAINILKIGAQVDLVDSQNQTRFIIKDQGSYLHKEKVYEYEELEPLFMKSDEALSYYQMSLKKDYMAKRSTWVMSFTGASTVLLFILAENQAAGSLSYSKFGNLGIVTLVLTGVVLLFRIRQNLLGAKYRKSSIQSYNNYEIIQNGYRKNLSYLSLGTGQYGLGIVYSF